MLSNNKIQTYHHARLKGKEHLFCYQAQLEGNFFCCVCARAYLRTLMTRKSCAVGMRNPILRNHLNLHLLQSKLYQADTLRTCAGCLLKTGFFRIQFKKLFKGHIYIHQTVYKVKWHSCEWLITLKQLLSINKQ